ncbi:ATP-dependent DNA helicase [Hydrogenophaga sp. NFH-34]|uniref:ATP-dependent DNA helicase n=1 Tax=Hydrogenophaga sp. NFH-34 TaxID=2744446 RepID=UPI001F37CC5D|nr:ATP-dependent DNA helicase [Hydrogenophaga sp. NFH-34]
MTATAPSLVPEPDADAPLGAVAVRALCEFAARSGDLDLRFSPSPTGAEGIAGHGTVTARRGEGYQREVPLASHWQGLRVQGRADGWDPAARRLEEIKTHRGDAHLISPAVQALHWAQARVYGWMLCEQLGLAQITLALIYFNIDTGVETPLVQTHDAAALQAHFADLCQRYSGWARQEQAHRRARNAWLQTLPFPFARFRAGQRDLAAAVYRCHKAGQPLMAQAPTGIGKTVATLFGALRAMPAGAHDKLFYLTARTTGRQLALDALAHLSAGAGPAAAPLRVIERVARDKACEHPDKACHGDACPLARGFYDRLPAAREAAVRVPHLDQAALRETALAHQICPYHLGQEMLPAADVAVGDYNHFFDLGAHWHGLAVAQGWRVALLIDEAHNLIERARGMYSAALEPADFQLLRPLAPPALHKAFERLHRPWNALARQLAGAHTVLPGLPADFMAALQALCGEIADHLATHPADGLGDSPLQRWYFDALQFLRVSETFGDHALCDLTPSLRPRPPRTRVAQPVLSLRCLVPAPLLASRWEAAPATTLFSATLSPMDYVADMLGLPAATRRLDVPAPFAPDQLAVRVAPAISTRWSHRQASLTPIAEVLARQYREAPGNYLAFFSSFDYLEQALDRLRQRHPNVPTWAQTRGMSEPDRNAFIARFQPDGQGIGFAVLGGAFGEGIDLPGQRLIGAFVATLGLPQVGPVNEQLRQRLQTRFGRGHDYTYLFPGLQKVVQAAGRVIRTEHDNGTVWLLDDRYTRAEVRRLLPAWWPPAVTECPPPV